MSRRFERLFNLRRAARPSLASLSLVALLTAFGSAQQLLDVQLGTGADDLFGHAMANAGDVDGDGVDDLIVGSPVANNGGGVVYIRSGRDGSTLLLLFGNPGTQMGHAVAGLGDVTGDGVPEVAFSAPGTAVFASGAWTYDHVTVWDLTTNLPVFIRKSSADDQTGWSLAGGGDTDGDGYPELLIGVPRHDDFGGVTDVGRVQRLVLRPGFVGTYEVAKGDQAGMQMGFDVAWAGNLDGVGGDDYVVSAPFRNEVGLPGHNDVGRVYAFSSEGPLGTQLWSKRGPMETGGRFGWSLAGGVDYNGDGVLDVAVGAPYQGATNAGCVHVLHGDTGFTYASQQGPVDADQLGWDVGFVQTFGNVRVLAGSPGAAPFGATSDDPGAVQLLGGPFLSFTASVTADHSYGAFGRTVVNLGDINGDGAEEFAASEPFPLFHITDNPGSVYIYGGATHLAYWDSYGTGLAGSFGVPVLRMQADPVMATSPTMELGNSAGFPVLGALFLGFELSHLPFKGGAIQLNPVQIKYLTVPPAGLDLVVPFPTDLTLIGLDLYLQLAHVDPGAPANVAISRGLHLHIGM